MTTFASGIFQICFVQAISYENSKTKEQSVDSDNVAQIQLFSFFGVLSVYLYLFIFFSVQGSWSVGNARAVW